MDIQLREGLVLHTVDYEDKGKKRPVLYRAALSEMVVPYGDTNPAHNWQCAFDAGEYGIGQLANSLELGCDCFGHIHYFDAVMANSKGGSSSEFLMQFVFTKKILELHGSIQIGEQMM